MNAPDWRTEYRDATAAPHPAVKERVWRAMHESQPRRRRLAPLVALVVATAAALAFVAWPRVETASVRGDGYSFVLTSARVTREGPAFDLASGRLAVSAWSTPVVIHAGGKRIDVDAAMALVEVASDSVRVEALAGVVLVDGAEVRPLAERAEVAPRQVLEAMEDAEAPVLRAEASAERATRAQQWAEAASALSVVAGSESLRAEAALLKRGELELRHLNQPREALRTFDEGDARFPSGTLAQERALSALEATVALQRWPEALRRADDFLGRFPGSPRADEVRQVRAAAAQASGMTP